MKQELERVVTKGLDAVGYDLVEVRQGGTKSRMLIEVRIDRRDGSEVTVDDCATASRAIEALLDGGPLVPENYELQVSSPGERALRTPGDWRRFVGRWANILSPDFGGRFEARIKEVGEDDVLIVLDDRKKTEKRIPLAAIKEARLAFHL
ncbi:MAG TPA: ribosome maturation factor RimP [Gemmatimonadaceae bacterium]|nr:ribosome maturation factor RimP [Gemmatimonadaceae bacterium]